MANSPLPVGQMSNLPVFESAVIRIVELAATYLVHSTLFLLIGWALLPVLLRLFRKPVWPIGKRRPDGQEYTSYAPALTERVWKLAAILAMVTAPLSVLTGWSRPAFEWSFIERPSHDEVIVVIEPPDNTASVRSVTLPAASSLADETANAKPPVESSTFLSVEEPPHHKLVTPPAEIPFDPAFDESVGRSVAELRAEAALLALNRLDSEAIESPMISSNERPLAAELNDRTWPSDDPINAAAHRPDESRTRSAKLAWLGCALIAWFAVSLGRMIAKGIALHRWLARCQPATGELSKTLNKLSRRCSSIRLLIATGTVDPRNGRDETNGTHVGASPSAPSSKIEIPSLGQVTCLAAASLPSVPFVPSLPIPPAIRRPTAITEPFACGLLRWTIVLPAGIEQKLCQSEMRALLAHEVAHLVRRDPWWLWLGEVVCTCLAFQPLNFLARRRWQQAAELLCDDWAVERDVAATSLASCLTKLAEWRLDRRSAVMGLTAVGRSGSLTQRIEWLLRNGRASEPKRSRARLVATLTTFSLGLLVGLYGPRLTLIVPAEANAAQAASNDETALTDSRLADSSDGDDALAARLWSDIELDLHHTLSELARLESRLAVDRDPEVASLAHRLRYKAASLQERISQ